MRRLAFGLFLALAVVSSSDKAAAMDPATVAVGFSLARTGIDLLEGDPQSAIIGGNRELLLGMHGKLQQIEERQKWVQKTLTEMPEDFSRILVRHEAKELINQLRTQVLELGEYEELFELETKHNIEKAWQRHGERLKALRKDIRGTLRLLKVQHNPMLMAARVAAYGLLVQVQGQIIAIDKMMLGLDEGIAQSMGFGDDVAKRANNIKLELEVRRALVLEAYEGMTELLEGPILEEVTKRMGLLRLLHERNGTIDHWFPDWLRIYPPSNGGIGIRLDHIAELLKRGCPHGTFVPSADVWLRELVFQRHVPHRPEPVTGARGRARQTEKECGIGEGKLTRLTRLRSTPYLPETTLEEGRHLWHFRTPVYKKKVTYTPGRRRFILHDVPDEYVIESRQYEVGFEFLNIPRVEETWAGSDRWGREAKRLPGLDMVTYWAISGENWRENVPEGLHDDFKRRLGYITDRRAFWWDGPHEFEVHYVTVRDLLWEYKKVQNKIRKIRHRRTLSRSHDTGTCFMGLRDRESPLSEEINRRVDLMSMMMDKFDRGKVQLVPRDFCSNPIRATPWGAPPAAVEPTLRNPENWADVHNERMHAIEFMLRVQALVERSYVGFREFLERLDAGEEPELGHVIHPGVAATLIAQERDPARTARIIEMLAQEEESSETDAWIQTVIQRTGDRIEYEQRNAALASRLRMALAFAELTYEYAIPDGQAENLGEHKEVIQEVEIDIDQLDEETINTMLEQLAESPSDQGRQREPMRPDVVRPQISTAAPGKSQGRPAPPDEPGLITSTPVMNLIGGLRLGQLGAVVIKSGGRTVARLWLKRNIRKKTTMLLESLQEQAILGKGAGSALVTIRTRLFKYSDKLRAATMTLKKGMMQGKRDFEFPKGLNFKEVVELGKRYVCGDAVKCTSLLRKTEYGGVLLKKGLRQFRIGIKDASKRLSERPEANFEYLGPGNRSNVHYILPKP